ncbi:MAG: 50S ribosomal protein L17 [bacterium]
MRHGKSGRKLSLEASERKAFFRNITDSLITKGKIKTTVTRAKEVRKFAENMITLAKEGTLASKREAISFLRTKESFVKLFGEYAERYKDRNGGYTRITKAGYRAGDNAPMAYLEFITSEEPTTKKTATKRKRRRSTGKKDGETTTKETKKESKKEASVQE